MEIIQGSFGKKKNEEEEMTVADVFAKITEEPSFAEMEHAFCIAFVGELGVFSTNLSTPELYMLLDQIKMLLIGETYELQ